MTLLKCPLSISICLSVCACYTNTFMGYCAINILQFQAKASGKTPEECCKMGDETGVSC